MKKLLLMAVFALPLLFTSCKKEEIKEEIKEKDLASEIAGLYQATRTGSCSMVVNGQTFTFPMDGSGTAMITRISNNRILLNLGGNDDYAGTVVENYVSFEPFSDTYTDQSGGTLSLTISGSGTISGTTINIRETYIGQYFFQGSSFPVRGTGALVMYKI